MARDFLTPIDLAFNQLLGLRIENRDTAPAGVDDGVIYFDTTDNCYKLRQAGAWFELATSGVLVGTFVQRPVASAGAIGTLYYATDSETLFIDTGGTWKAFAPAVPTASTGDMFIIRATASGFEWVQVTEDPA